MYNIRHLVVPAASDIKIKHYVQFDNVSSMLEAAYQSNLNYKHAIIRYLGIPAASDLINKTS